MGREESLAGRDGQARGFPGKIKAYESKQAISVGRPWTGSVEQRARAGEKLAREANFKECTVAIIV